uniref:RING-type domain-containing protein n=1 Tax=Oryza brachyantha TaxID=4533 RepID=J3LU05_ORYBR
RGGGGAAASAACACPICLESFQDEAYLDTCFHSFCYKCICQWVKIVSTKRAEPLSSVQCPLCKTVNVSIIHGFDGESFQRHYINQDPRKRHLSHTHELISQFYSIKYITGHTSSVQQFWKQRKYLRKNIWLQTWLRQEIQALTQDENVDTIVYHIHGVIEAFMKRQEKEYTSKTTPPEKKREKFKCLLSDAARPFLLGRTERFVTEVELFLVSHLNIDAYSKVRVQRLKESTSHVSREQDVLPQDRSLEDHYLYFLGDETDCNGEI